ncbi:MAG: methyltransferase [Candidatus Berkelbacteria bacterium]|nr:methyltransferase [Candidatus Berkelbacteria bacterium]
MIVHKSPVNEPENVDRIIGIPCRLIVPYAVPALIKHLDFFNKFNELGPSSAEKIASSFGFNPRVLDAVLCYLCKEGLLNRVEGDVDTFELSTLAKGFLLKSSEYDLTKFALIMDGAVMGRLDEAIAQTIKTGEPANWNEEVGNWEEGMRSGLIAKTFSEGMMSRGKYLQSGMVVVLKDVLSDKKKLLDLGGSLGDYSGKLSEALPDLACTVYELPNVVSNTEKNIAEKNYVRVDTLAGDMFKDDLPNNYDVHFYSNVIHDWNNSQVKVLFEKSFNSLPSGGSIVIHDLHLDDGKKSPDIAVDHSLYLSIITSGRCYSYKEIGDMLEGVGFKDTAAYQTVGGYSVIVGHKS